MAKLSTKGIEDLDKKLSQIESGLKAEALKTILMAGAEEVRKSWQEQITSKHHVRTGTMLKSVGITEPVLTGDKAYVEIYPQGTDSHRITNAQKAFIISSGRQANKRGKGQIKGDKFVQTAEKNAKQKAIDAMQKALDDFIAEKG